MVSYYRKPGRREGLTRPGVPLNQELAEFCRVLIESGLTLKEVTYVFQRRFLIELLIRFNGNQCHVARDQGMHRNTLGRLLKELKIDAKLYKRGHSNEAGTGTSLSGRN